jgi:trk system potassium uptake protein TrkH
VIHIGALLHTLGLFLLALAGTMLVPLFYGLIIGDDLAPFLISIAITGTIGLLLYKNASPSESELSQREAVLLVFAVWIASSTFGCLPLYLSPYFPSFTDAFFEATSGFTTTGATILADVEILSNSMQFWRCFTHWLGGMGIVLLGIAVLPLVGIGGMPLYRAEFSGAKSEKLKPRITETALALWRIYFVLTLVQYLALRLAGMDPFDALCHTFSTVATGGFSTRTASVAAFNSPMVEGIIIVFMLLAGMNFTLHYRLWVERRYYRFITDVELRFYLSVVAVAATATSLSLIFRDQYAPFAAILDSLFKTTSIMTGTGLVTENYEQWNAFPQVILLALMFFGGCTGSTTGGLKLHGIYNRRIKVTAHSAFAQSGRTGVQAHGG